MKINKGYAYIIITAFLFSTAEVSGKLITGLNPYQFTFIRFLIGGLILSPFAVRHILRKELKFKKNHIMHFILLGVLCVVISMCLFQLAVVYTSASKVAIVFSVNPVFTIPFAYFILKEKVYKSTIISLVLSVIGVCFILNPLSFSLNKEFIGMLLALLSAVVFSIYSVIGKKMLEIYGGVVYNSLTFIFGSIILLVILIITRVPIVHGIESGNIIQILYAGIFVTGLGYLFYFLSIEETSAIETSSVFFIKPALAPIIAFIILGEKISISTFVGIMFIVFGSYLNMLSKKKVTSVKKEAMH